MKQKSVLQLRGLVELTTVDRMKRLLRLIIQSVSKFSVTCVESNEFTQTDMDDIMCMEDFERVLQSGGKAGTRRLNGEQDGPSLLSWYKDRRKILVVKLGDKLHHINDKNNYRLIKSSLDSNLKKSKTCIREFDCLKLLSYPEELDLHLGSREHHEYGYTSLLTKTVNFQEPIGTDTPRVTGRESPESGSADDLKPTTSCSLFGSCFRGCAEKDGSQSSEVGTSSSLSRVQSKTKADKILSPTERIMFGGPTKGVKCVPPEPLDEHKLTLAPVDKTVYKNGLGRDGGNVPMHSIQATDGACSYQPMSSVVSSIGPQYKSIIQSKPGSNLSSNSLNGRASGRRARYPDMEDPNRRHMSFTQNDWESHPDRPDVATLTENGFFCTGLADLVRCYQCGIGLKDWSPEDVVMDEHIRHSPDCSFLAEKLGQERLNQLKCMILYGTEIDSGLGYAGAALTQVPTATRNENLARSGSTQSPKQGQNKNASTELTYPIRHSGYRSVESRLASFVNFPPSAQQDHRRLAIAGFFYTGTRDICRCFCCDGGMQHWVAEDDPVQEHAKHFSTCAYIRQLKGDEYINRVRVEAGMETSGENSQASQSSETVTSQMATLALNTNQGTLSGNSDFNRSTILKNVLASGFEKDKVMKAVDVLVKRGMSTFTEDDIVNIVLDTPEVNGSLESSANTDEPETLLQENERLKSFVECMLCQTAETNILFLPCAHHKVCAKCSENLNRCPVCQKQIVQKVRTYMS